MFEGLVSCLVKLACISAQVALYTDLEVVLQAELAAALLADGEVISQRARGIRAVLATHHHHGVVMVTGGIPNNAGACGGPIRTRFLDDAP